MGLRPINAAVDVTNYISYDRARPLHVYDADKLHGPIMARLGKKGESFLALDGKPYEVDETMCVIADQARVLGLGGVMGGEATGCTEATTNIFIESAYFDPARTAATGRKTGINSDSRYRFERGIDPQSEMLGLNLATQMILEFCGGEPSNAVVAGKEPAGTSVIAFDPARVQKLSGATFSNTEIVSTLKTLGCTVEGEAPSLRITTPSWRPDIHGAADLVEEVVRLSGADRIPSTPLPRDSGVTRAVLTASQKRVLAARRTLAARGLVEAVTWSFIGEAQARHFGGGQASLRLANPISSEMTDMRPSLLPGLIAAARANANRGFAGRGAFRSRPDLCRRETRRSKQRRERRQNGHREIDRRRPALGRRREGGRCFRRQGRCPKRARSPRSCCRHGADHAQYAGLVSPGPVRGFAARSRRSCSAISASCIPRRSKPSMSPVRSPYSRCSWIVSLRLAARAQPKDRSLRAIISLFSVTSPFWSTRPLRHRRW